MSKTDYKSQVWSEVQKIVDDEYAREQQNKPVAISENMQETFQQAEQNKTHQRQRSSFIEMRKKMSLRNIEQILDEEQRQTKQDLDKKLYLQEKRKIEMEIKKNEEMRHRNQQREERLKKKLEELNMTQSQKNHLKIQQQKQKDEKVRQMKETGHLDYIRRHGHDSLNRSPDNFSQSKSFEFLNADKTPIKDRLSFSQSRFQSNQNSSSKNIKDEGIYKRIEKVMRVEQSIKEQEEEEERYKAAVNIKRAVLDNKVREKKQKEEEERLMQVEIARLKRKEKEEAAQRIFNQRQFQQELRKQRQIEKEEYLRENKEKLPYVGQLYAVTTQNFYKTTPDPKFKVSRSQSGLKSKASSIGLLTQENEQMKGPGYQINVISQENTVEYSSSQDKLKQIIHQERFHLPQKAQIPRGIPRPQRKDAKFRSHYPGKKSNSTSPNALPIKRELIQLQPINMNEIHNAQVLMIPSNTFNQMTPTQSSRMRQNEDQKRDVVKSQEFLTQQALENLPQQAQQIFDIKSRSNNSQKNNSFDSLQIPDNHMVYENDKPINLYFQNVDERLQAQQNIQKQIINKVLKRPSKGKKKIGASNGGSRKQSEDRKYIQKKALKFRKSYAKELNKIYHTLFDKQII